MGNLYDVPIFVFLIPVYWKFKSLYHIYVQEYTIFMYPLSHISVFNRHFATYG